MLSRDADLNGLQGEALGRADVSSAAGGTLARRTVGKVFEVWGICDVPNSSAPGSEAHVRNYCEAVA